MGALDGIRVVDFSQVILGPVCTQVLADHGADVVKIERPGQGDLARSFGPFWPDQGSAAGDRRSGESAESTRYLSMNRNKRGLAVDLKHPEGKAVVQRLIDQADVVVSNFRPGVMESLGLGYHHLQPRNPRLIYATGSGWGSRGPMADARRPGHELLAQSLAGLAAKNAGPDGIPRALPGTISDFTTGMILVQGILLALLARARTGRGQAVEVCLLDTLLSVQMWDESSRLNLGERDSGVPDHQNPLQGIYRTRDGFIALVGWFRPNPLGNVCTALGLPDYSQDERFDTFERIARPEHAAVLRDLIQAAVLTKTTDAWLAILQAHDILCGPVLAPGEVFHHPQAIHNGMVVEIPHPPLGTMRAAGPPAVLSETPATMRMPPPTIGEHTQAVLADAGYSGEEIVRLYASGAVA